MNSLRPAEGGWNPPTMRGARTVRRAGFALLIAVMLLAFAVAVLVGLAAYTRIETAVAGYSQRQAQARENARLALAIALGQLQRYAGPDRRVTATAENFGHILGTRHYTGVWDAVTTSVEPLTWLVSGNEGFAPDGAERPLAFSPVAPGPRLMELVGRNSAGDSPADGGHVLAPLRDLSASGVPGTDGSITIGRYAWWVGDLGVKTAIAASDSMRLIRYVPYDSPEVRSRLRQQTARGAAPPDLEPLAATNAAVLENIIAGNQLAFLRAEDGAQIGLARVRGNFHTWTTNSFAVLADTKSGGLRRDLSVAPEMLGDAFVAWADWRAHMEPMESAGPSAPLPAYGTDPLRRRHRIVPPISDGRFTFTTAPVLSLFFLQFNIRRTGGNSAPAVTRDLEVRARMVCQLWNPWTAALVPEDLRLDITGLPTVAVIDSRGGNQPLNLQSLFGRPQMSIRLTAADVAFPGDPDDHSWLPGRVYYWRTKAGDRDEWGTEFYNRSMAAPNAQIWTSPAGLEYFPPAANSVTLRISGPPSRLTLTLRRASDGAMLATYRSPEFEAFATEPRAVNSNDEYRIGFPVRMVESTDLAAVDEPAGWLQGFGSDLRALVLDEPMLRALNAGAQPDQYVGVGGSSVFTDPDRLLDRVMGKTGMSYNEDVPVFELPRSPVLSLGVLQHLQVEGSRPFAIGNGWGGAVAWDDVSVNAIFDRFFVSGLARGVGEPDIAPVMPLPNPLLRVLARKAGAEPATAQDLLSEAATGYSSKHLLQGGAFNLNAARPEVWTALLHAGRFLGGEEFRHLNPNSLTGSAADAETAGAPLTGAVFFRFPQSAQETYKADRGYAASTAVPPDPPAIASAANTHLFRRGVRALAPEEVSAFADAIGRGLQRKHAASGPFRSIEEFLNTSPLFEIGGEPRSLMEAAIATAGLNAEIPEFSSQFLTQADLMNLLAPLLFPRSDTFVIRAYGEAVNPATQASEGRAWCEATVQRVPGYFDPSQPAETGWTDLNEINRTHGRRFKVVSIRWLTRADI